MAGSNEHLANAKNYIAKGEDFYRKAAEEIVAAMKEDPTLSYASASAAVGKSKDFARRLVTAYTSGARASDGSLIIDWQSGDTRAVSTRLREAEPEEIAEKFLADPAIRAKVSMAQEIAHAKVEERSRKAEREAVGEREFDELEDQQRLHDAEAELFKARRALIETLRILNTADTASLPDSWREEFLRTFDDIADKVQMGRELLAGTLDAELDKLLSGEV